MASPISLKAAFLLSGQPYSTRIPRYTRSATRAPSLPSFASSTRNPSLCHLRTHERTLVDVISSTKGKGRHFESQGSNSAKLAFRSERLQVFPRSRKTSSLFTFTMTKYGPHQQSGCVRPDKVCRSTFLVAYLDAGIAAFPILRLPFRNLVKLRPRDAVSRLLLFFGRRV